LNRTFVWGPDQSFDHLGDSFVEFPSIGAVSKIGNHPFPHEFAMSGLGGFPLSSKSLSSRMEIRRSFRD
jgi:hypothetical protein